MNLLNHIAFVMDGNSSWAKRNGKPNMDGYLRGMRTMANTIVNARNLGVRYVTFYAFSSENWKRPKHWIDDFMALATHFFENDDAVQTILDIGARLKVIGDKSKLTEDLRKIIDKNEKKTENNERITVQLAVSYGARDEIVRTVKKMAKLNIEFSEESISNNLDTAGIPDPQLIIRTSGKQRLSNFLLWQASYSEFYFSDLLWPDFDKNELQKAINEFWRRCRTYGQ
ncbi:MAG: di-trans,poly-cis-decaprenylcistransferase [Holosporales bacterium]|jgi:undecaprenyl diphosphate synthase|nr:di-trans,poly-cis-decaprenylcistransferase [Holosporales bacterium]